MTATEYEEVEVQRHWILTCILAQANDHTQSLAGLPLRKESCVLTSSLGEAQTPSVHLEGNNSRLLLPQIEPGTSALQPAV